MSTALLVVDLQRGLCEGEGAMADIDAVVGRVNRAITAQRAAGGLVVFVQHEDGDWLVRGSDRWQLDPRLAAADADLRVAKSACDAFHRTTLAERLAARGIDRVAVCGAQSEYCVDSTVRGALAHGLPVTLLRDAHTTRDSDVLAARQIVAHHNATLAALRSYGPRVTLVDAGSAAVAA